MNPTVISQSIGNIDARFVEEAADYQVKKLPVFLKWASLAACFCLFAIAAVSVAHLIRTPDRPLSENGVINQTLKDGIEVHALSSAVVYPWEYLKEIEKYVLTVNGAEYVGWGETPLDESLIQESLGSFFAKARDGDPTHDTTLEAFRIKSVSPDFRIAVKMGDRYYVYGNHVKPDYADFGALWDAYGLDSVLTLSAFTRYHKDSGIDYRTLTDAAYVKTLLADCRTAKKDGPLLAPSSESHDETPSSGILSKGYDAGLPHAPAEQDFSGVAYVAFSVSSDTIGVRRRSLTVYQNGWLVSMIDNFAYSFYIGEEKADEIITYTVAHSEQREQEPFCYFLVGTLTAVSEGFVLIDDTALCQNEKDGRVYKLLTGDIGIKRCFDYAGNGITVGDIVMVEFRSPIIADADGTIAEGTYYADKAYLTKNGEAYIYS